MCRKILLSGVVDVEAPLDTILLFNVRNLKNAWIKPYFSGLNGFSGFRVQFPGFRPIEYVTRLNSYFVIKWNT